MKIYIEGRELNPESGLVLHTNISGMEIGKVYYFTKGNFWGSIQSMMLIRKGWNSLHFIKYLESI